MTPPKGPPVEVHTHMVITNSLISPFLLLRTLTSPGEEKRREVERRNRGNSREPTSLFHYLDACPCDDQVPERALRDEEKRQI